MSLPANDLVLRETLSGPLSLGETDPCAGAGKGRRARFTLHATLRVDDLEAFLRDPQLGARIEGRISYPPLGKLIRVKEGRFHLFQGGDTPHIRRMTYGLTFEVGGRTYRLEGTKTLLRDDLPRLYCLLHEGPDARGRVVGAGVLTLGVRGVLATIRGMHSERYEGRKEAEAIERFGRLFLGTLWDVYAPRVFEEDPFEESGGFASW